MTLSANAVPASWMPAGAARLAPFCTVNLFAGGNAQGIEFVIINDAWQQKLKAIIVLNNHDSHPARFLATFRVP